jgi:rhodanese-related sulfurtransferase
MHMSVEELRGLIANGATVIDAGERSGAREIRGAIRYRPHDLLTPSHLTLPLPQERPVVLYDEHGEGKHTAEIADRLRASGFSDVRILEGGFAAWHAAGGETQEASIEQMVPPQAADEVQELDRRL